MQSNVRQKKGIVVVKIINLYNNLIHWKSQPENSSNIIKLICECNKTPNTEQKKNEAQINKRQINCTSHSIQSFRKRRNLHFKLHVM